MIETNQGYLPKDLHFGDMGREKLTEGVRKMSNAVKSTLGPGGNTVLIESPYHTHGITVTKDGVTVAKAVDLNDPVENLAVRMMKEAAERTASSAGDGTTTAIVLTEAMVLGGNELMTTSHNRTEVLRAMVEIADKTVDRLKRRSKKLSSAMLLDVATISSNNDREIGRMIADTYKSVGRAGLVTIQRSQSSETYIETTTGLKFDRGYLSPLFVNDQRKDECVFEDTMVLVADVEISNILQIENILKPVLSEGKKLLVIAPCAGGLINTFAANVMKGSLKVCAVAPPNFGYKQHELMQDIAVSVGAKYFSEKTGDDLSLMNFSDLGHAAKVVVSRDSTIIIKSDARSKQEVIDERVKQLRAALSETTKKGDKDFILERIAALTGGVGVIFVGGNTDLEQKELYDRVDDAVCAVRSALEEGVLPGAGKALYEIDLDELFSTLPAKHTAEWEVALGIMRRAYKAPLRQILQNVGLTEEMYIGEHPAGHGLNIKTGDFGDLVEMGVIDPLKVTRSALQNAVSVATTILSTNAIITMARVYEQTTK
jgi:chaperonin GroEL